ncbi:hypothetical protein VDGD_21036 [Verticillium dahliae]|nr:hypothetical protein VdG2_04971 [Verticillium dahliae VDG2]KAF3354906.1 hypothetical protein VdG1_07145 [Verticillium dahliae VDG1]RBQ82584.1 hypothetical protein VDGD_21036 [Verticillium dahliae]
MKNRNEPRKMQDKGEPPRPSERGGWKQSTVLPRKEPNKRRKQQKLRGHREWKKRIEPPERRKSAGGRRTREKDKLKSVLEKLHGKRESNMNWRLKQGYAERRKEKQEKGLPK